MSVDTRHPELTAARLAEYALIRASVGGESNIKAGEETYLAKPSGFLTHPDQGTAAYAAYTMRAQYPEIYAPSVSAMMGIVHAKEVQIEKPSALDYLDEDADGEGMPLEAFHRRITRALLELGRIGVLADAPMAGGDPVLKAYAGDAVVNWDKDFFVLDECHNARDGFEWKSVEQYRVIQKVDGKYSQTVYTRKSKADPFVETVVVTPSAAGGRGMVEIPMAIGNAIDVTPRVITPPLIGVARAAVANYQLSADYRYQLYMSGQETLVAINGDAPKQIGAGVVHMMMGAEGMTPDLRYVSPSCSGINAHKEAMVDNREMAVMAGARLLEQSAGVQESGEARKLRFASETATLMSVAQNSCAILERSLRNVAMFKGLPVENITVTPPADLMDATMTPSDFAALFGVYERGGMSWETYHENGRRGGIMSPERTAEEEFALVDGQANDGEETV